MRLIAGLMDPTKGKLCVLGLDSVKEAQTIQRRISYMPQKFGLYEDLTIQETWNFMPTFMACPKKKAGTVS